MSESSSRFEREMLQLMHVDGAVERPGATNPRSPLTGGKFDGEAKEIRSRS